MPKDFAQLSFEGDSRPRVLHLSADFPDPIEPAKTRVIRTLLELSRERFDHRVVSLNRVASRLAELVRSVTTGHLRIDSAPFDAGVALDYHAPGRGLLHRTMLNRLGDRLVDEIAAAGLRPDLLVGHKLTVEGLAVQRIARRLSLPFAMTVQGDTDTKILSARPDLIPAVRSVYHEARQVTFFAPWTRQAIEARLGKRAGPTSIIPCPTELDQPLRPQPGGNGLLSVFHLKSHARKNLGAMAQALRLLAADDGAAQLAICGGGSPEDLAAARASAGEAGGLVFEGPLGREAVTRRMNAATGFVLPSKRETFGLVFVEALFAGLPIIHPDGQAVSGYFDDCPFALAVPADDPVMLAGAMRRLIAEEAMLKQALAEWQQSPAAQRFTRAAIGQAYIEALSAATFPGTGSAIS